MFTISAQFMRHRGCGEGRDGVVTLTVTDNRKESGDYRRKREIRLDIYGADKSVIESHKDEILPKLRLLYCVIERSAETGKELSLDGIAADYRRALDGDPAFADVIDKAATSFPLRADIVTVGRELRGCFDYVYPAKRVNTDSLSDYIDCRIADLKNEGKTSRARAFESTHARLKEFTGMDNLSMGMIDGSFVRDFADWLKKGDITESTQSFYLRTLRSILNHAGEEGLIAGNRNWFKGIGTRILFEKSTGKDAGLLGRENILKIKRLDLSSDRETALVRDMFMFGFYCRGMELVDIAYLTPQNIKSGFLAFSRRKAGKGVIVPLDPDALKIIRRYEPAESRYLFPFLYEDGRFSFSSMRNRVQTAIKKIGKAVGFPSLTFSMNIAAYKNILSQCPVSRLL